MRALWVLPFLLFAPLQAQEADGELLKNPGFNEDADGDELPDGWSTSHDRIVWREKVYMGKDYEILSAPGAYVLATQSVRLIPGEKYTISFRARGEETGIAGALIVHGEERPTREMPILWNVALTEQFEEYVATFVAPNPVAVLYIYNLARDKGRVAYDHVSLRQGDPDHAIIGQLSFRPIDRPLQPPLQTPHIDWATPTAGGPVKAFSTIRTFRCQREFLDLCQCIDLDYDLIHTGYDGDECTSETGRRAMERLKESAYETYIIPSRVGGQLLEDIKKRVEAGAGLVIVEGFGQAGKFLDPGDLQEAAEDHYLRRGVPWDIMPEKILRSVQVGQLGQGRVVRLLFPLDVARAWGILPYESNLESYKSRQFEYWHYWTSLLSRAILWSARREGQARLSLAEAGPSSFEVAAADAPEGARLRYMVRSGREIRFDGALLRTGMQQIALDGQGAASLPIPQELPAGTVIADVMLQDAAGDVLDWGSFVSSSPQRVQIAAVTADKEAYLPGEPAVVEVRLTAEAAVPATVRCRAIDPFGRVIWQEEQSREVAAGETVLGFSADLSGALRTHLKAFVSVLCDGEEQDSRWCTLLRPDVGEAAAAADFLVAPWGSGMTPPIQHAQFMARTVELGLNAEFATTPYVATEFGLPIAGYIGGAGAFREDNYTADGVRSRCLSDPAVVEHYTTQAREQAATQKPFGLYAVGITDEGFLTSRHKRHEVCFSPPCQEAYRTWLRERYGTLEALNAQWDTEYDDWSQVGGVRTEDVRGKTNFSPFVDFRTFMTDLWVQSCRTITDAYHEVCPHTPVGHTNTFGVTPFDGNDYWKLCTKTGFGWGQEYSEAIKGSAHKAIFDIWRSFTETPEALATRPEQEQPFFNHGWIGYDHRVAAAHYEPWWLALHGARGISYFATNSIEAARNISWSLIFPTLSTTEFSQAVAEALADLRGGCGKLLMEYERQAPQIALLWSHPSMLVAWCESTWEEVEPNERPGTDAYGSHFRSALDFRQHVNELQLDYEYLSPEQVLQAGGLEKHRLLYLPFTVAGSPELVEALEAYVQAGGVLVGDLRCLRTDEHGKPLAGSPALQRLFGVSRTGDGVDYGETEVTFTAAAEGLDLTGWQAEVHGRESLTAAGATALAAHASGEPAVFVQRRGEGLSVYLNFRLPEYDVATRELVAQLTSVAGVPRPVQVSALQGEAPPRCYERNTFSRGPITVHGLVRDHRRCTDTDPVTVDFGVESHLYDIRARRYLGHVSQTRATIAPGGAALYACLPYRVSGLEVRVPERIEAGAQLPVEVTVGAEGGQPGDHVVHLQVIDAAGRAQLQYAENHVAVGGQLRLSLPTALNDRPGTCRVRARDLLSGETREAIFEMAAAG